MPFTPGERIGSYEIVALLGAGGMGEVYRARDVRLGRQVALKFLHQSVSADQTALQRFSREARAASMLNHPNIVTVYEIGDTPIGRFIAMELVEGRTLRGLAREALSTEQMLNVALQAAKALAAAHAAGIVHRDIKPDNLMLRDDGYVKVLDFGLARLVPGIGDPGEAITLTAPTGTGTVIGTLQYMSPEQARGDSVTPASDIFSLGATLYELATGEHPFAASSGLGMASAILSQTPLPPSRINPELPSGFDALILDMLEKDPRRRPSSAQVDARLTALAIGHDAPPAAAPLFSARAPFVGREAEAAALAASFERATTSHGLVHAVVAEAGFGKTAVIEHFLLQLQGRTSRCWIGRGRCSERLAGAEAYLPFLEALDTLLRGPNGDAVARAMRLVAPAWFAQVHPSSPSGSRAADAVTGSSEQMKRQLLALLTELTRTSPLVLFLDDVHWADASTVDLLSYLSQHFDSLRLLLLVAYRPSDLMVAQHPFVEVKLHLQSRGRLQETRLRPFDRSDVAHYLATVYARHELPPEFISLLHERTQGTPLFVVDLMRQLVDRGVVADRDGVWRLEQSIDNLEPDLPQSVKSAIQRTIDRLGEADRRLLVAASVQGAEFDSAVVAKAIGMPSDEVEERLERLERIHGLVRLIEERELARRTPSLRYAFSHILYQNALHATVRASRRVTLSRAVATAIHELWGNDPALTSQLAVLYEAAHEFDKAAACFLRAARAASRLYANKEAVLAARRGLAALQALPDAPERARLELQLQIELAMPLTGLQGYASSEVEGAYSRARDLCRTLGDTPSLLPVLHGLYRFYIVRGRLHTAREIVQQLIGLAEASGDPLQILIARAAMGAPLVHLAEFEAAVSHLDAGLAFYETARSSSRDLVKHGADPGMASMLWLAIAHWLLGRPEAALEINRQAREMASQQRNPFGIAYAESLTAWLHQYRGDAEAVLRHAEASIQISRTNDFVQWLSLGCMYRAWALVAIGEHPEAIAELAEGIESFRRTGAELNLPHFLALLADAHLRAGDAGAGMEVIEDAIGFIDRNDDRCWEPEVYRLKGELLLKLASTAGPAEGERMTAAEAALRHALATAEAQGSLSLELRAAVSLARLLTRLRRGPEARALLQRALERLPSGSGAPELVVARELLAQTGS